MKEILENWRKFQAQEATILNEFLRGAARRDREWQKLASEDPDEALRQRKAEKQKAYEVIRNAFQQTTMTLAMLTDPTGVTGWPDLYNASGKLKDEPSVMHAGAWFLALLGALPGVGGVGRGAKAGSKVMNAADAAKILENADDVSAALRASGAQGRRYADEIDQLARQRRATYEEGGAAVRSTQRGAAARVSSNIAGTSAKPAINKIGKKSGVFVEDGRAMVNVDTPQGPVTFIFSSGESMQSVNPKTGMIGPSPRVWFPAGAQEAGHRYKKYGPVDGKAVDDIPDARFGKGNEKIWNSMIRPLPDKNWDPSEVQRYYQSRAFRDTGILHPSDLRSMGDGLGSKSPHNYLADKFGNGWAKKIGQNDELDDRVDWLVQTGYFMKITDPRSNYTIGKYASPDSEFGKIAAYLERLSPNGNPTDELINVFGPVTPGRGPDSYNAWRRGEWYVGSPTLLREHLDIFERWRKIAL